MFLALVLTLVPEVIQACCCGALGAWFAAIRFAA